VNLPPLILASASRDARIVAAIETEISGCFSDAAEILDEQLSPLELCQTNAHRKRARGKKNPDALVLGRTRCVSRRRIMGKPISRRRGTDADAAARPNPSSRHRHQPDSFARTPGTDFCVSTT